MVAREGEVKDGDKICHDNVVMCRGNCRLRHHICMLTFVAAQVFILENLTKFVVALTFKLSLLFHAAFANTCLSHSMSNLRPRSAQSARLESISSYGLMGSDVCTRVWGEFKS